ncbi:MAG: hypothetical protein WBB45_16590 [Cyclobacteriaceae bacterium]
MSDTKKTTSHDEIKKWAKEHDASPVKVKSTGGSSGEGLIRLALEGHSKGDDDLEEMTWDEFFKIFDDNNLAMLYDKESNNNFFKLVSRDS